MTRRFFPGLIIALGLFAVGVLVAFTVGRYPVTLTELIEVLVSRLGGREATVSPAVENVVLLVRGPRVIAAALVGAALAVAGTAFQGIFRNPLVSPDILGASSGAALGAVLGIYSRSASSASRPWPLPAGSSRSPPSTSSALCCARAIRSSCWFSPASSLARCSAPASAW